MEEQYLREIAAQLSKMNTKLEKLIDSLVESRDKLILAENKNQKTTQIGSSGDFNGEKNESSK